MSSIGPDRLALHQKTSDCSPIAGISVAIIGVENSMTPS
jgi:hypothetical protein